MLKLRLIYQIFKNYLRIKIILQQFIKFSLIFLSLISTIYGKDILIDSDSLTFDKTKNTAIFEGQVVLYFEDIVLKTSNLQIFYKNINSEREIDKIIIPTRLIAKKEKDQSIIIADSGEYLAYKSRLILEGNIKLLRQEDILKTNKLVYYTKLKKVNHHK